MSQSAQVDSIDALKHFRIALFKFAEAAGVALADAESDLHATQHWLDHEQYPYWQTQIRKRHEALERAKEALRMKKLFKDSTGRTPSAVDEEKAVRVAQARLEEAHQKFANVKKYSRVLQQETQSYKGHVQRFATALQADIPTAATALDSLVATLEAYVSLNPGDASASVGANDTSAPPPPPPMTDDGNGNPVAPQTPAQ